MNQLAMEFITKKHENQFRKGGDDYVTHPLAVARIIEAHGYSNDAVLTALFHDLLEDTDASEEEILSLSSREVLEAVKLLTKYDGYEMKTYIQRIKDNPIALPVKLADRIHNLNSAFIADNAFKDRYIQETQDYYLKLSEGTIFEPELKVALRKLKEDRGILSYCAFLRGINVNGVKIKMGTLIKLFEEMGFSQVSTVLATGNVVFESKIDKQEIKNSIEKNLSHTFQYEQHVYIKTASEITSIIKGADKDINSDKYHNYCVLLDDNVVPEELIQELKVIKLLNEERYYINNGNLYYIVPKTKTLDGGFGKLIGHKKYKNVLTSRNLNTLIKIQEKIDN